MNDLAARIEAVYMQRTGRTKPHGARAWFAHQAKVRRYTVSRWVAGTIPFSGPPLAVLELLEAAPQNADTCICCERSEAEAGELIVGPLGKICMPCITTLRRALL